MNHTNKINGLNCCEFELSNTLRRLWIEHVLWTRFFIISTAFDLPDLSFVTERLLENPGDFKKALKPFYSEKATLEFKKLLADHLLIAAELVNAAKAGDIPQVEIIRERWFANAVKIANLLGCINPCWSEACWRKLLFEHLRMTQEEAVLVLTGQYQQSIRTYDIIQAQALEMADVMTCGIIQQFAL